MSLLRSSRPRETDNASLLRPSQESVKPSLVATLWTSFQLAGSYILASLRRSKRSWCIGLSTVAVVVTFSALLMSAILSAPLIFLKLAEDQAGESDIVVTSEVTPANPLPTLNYTSVQDLVANNGAIRGVAPRWPLVGIASNRGLPRPKTLLSYVLGMDSEQEESIGLGRGWGLRPLGEQECYASSSLLRQLDLKGGAGELLDVNFDLIQILDTLSAVSGNGDSSLGGSGGNGTSASNQAAREAVIRGLLTASGVDLTSVTITVDAGVALEQALRNAGLLAPGQFFNSTGLGLVTIDLTPLVSQAIANAAAALSITGTYTIVDEFSSNRGKLASLLGNVVVLEAQYLPTILQRAILGVLQSIQNVLQPLATLAGTPSSTGAAPAGAQNANTQLSAGALAVIDALNQAEAAVPGLDYGVFKQFALEIDAVATGRLDTYLKGSADAIDKGVTGFVNALMDQSLGGDYPVNVGTPLGETLGGLQFIALFLNQVFIVVLVVLALLGAVVIYSLVLGDVDARTFELGMLRALGMRHITLGQLLAFQTAAFVIPGVLIGLSVASLLNLGIAAGIRWYAALQPSDWSDTMAPAAWWYASAIGIFVPVLAVIFPIRRALGGVLRDALDVSHQVVSEVTVKIMRLKDVGLSPAQAILSILLTICGFVTFYALPLSFLFRDFAAFLGILTAVLLGMLVGLAILAQVAQPWLERGVLKGLLFCGRDERTLGTVVRKNLDGHRPRNGKTALLISLTIGFLVFAAAMFRLQANSIVSNVRMFLGGDVVALALTTATGTSTATGSGGNATSVLALPQESMTSYLQGLMSSLGDKSPVLDFTFVSMPLTAAGIVRRTSLSNLVNIPRFPQNRLYGVQRNYLSVAYSEYTVTTESSANGVKSTASGVGSFFSRGGGGVKGFVNAEPVKALYEGAGSLSLPLEASLGSPPPSLASSPSSSVSNGFVCNASTFTQSQSGYPYPPWLQRIPLRYLAGANSGAAALSTVTADSSVSFYSPSTVVNSDGTVSTTSPTAVTVSPFLPGSAQSPNISALIFGTPSSPSNSFTYRRAADVARTSCGYDGSRCSGGVGAANPSANSSSVTLDDRLLLMSQLLFFDYSFCVAACNDALVQNFRSSSSATTNGDWSWMPPSPAGGGGSGGSGYQPQCALPGLSAAQTDGLNRYFSAIFNTSSFASTAPFPFPLEEEGALSVLIANAKRSLGNSAGDLPADASLFSEALANASSCYLPAQCIAVSRSSPFDSSDRITSAYLRYVDLLMSEAMRGGASLSTSTPLALRLITRDPASSLQTTRTYLAKSRAMLQKLPGFLFSSYPQTARTSPVLARMEDAYRIYLDAVTDYNSIVDYVTGSAVAASSAPSTTSSATPAGSTNGTSPAYTLQKSFPPVPLWFPSSPSWLVDSFGLSPLDASSTILNSAPLARTLLDLQQTRNTNATTRQLEALVGRIAGQSPPLPVLPPSLDDAGWASPPARSQAGGGDEDLASSAQSVASALPSVPAGTASAIRAFAGTPMTVNNTVFLSLDLGVCGLVGGMQFPALSIPAAGQPVAVSLFALSEPSGMGLQRVATVVIQSQGIYDPATSPLLSATFGSFSARYWLVTMTPLFAQQPASLPLSTSVVFPPLTLAVGRVSSVAGACKGTTLGISDAVPRLPKHRLLVKLRPGVTEQERQGVINGLRSNVRSAAIQVQDTQSLIASTDVATLGLDIFFNFVAALALTLAFFSTWLSFSANVRENAVEAGILRSLGLPAVAVTRAYCYEALSVVLSSFTLGTLVGLLVAITLTLQFNLFTELPFVFIWPYSLFFFTLLACILLALVSSYVPAKEISKRMIASVLKGKSI